MTIPKGVFLGLLGAGGAALTYVATTLPQLALLQGHDTVKAVLMGSAMMAVAGAAGALVRRYFTPS